jgi:oxygen-independent coproporphyrinogen III oxidase
MLAIVLTEIKARRHSAHHAGSMDRRILERLAQPAPRYTSYPTSPHFTPAVDPDVFAGWLSELPADSRLSLYLHIPFCDTLCWFCGCHTRITRRYEPVAGYLATLEREMALVAEHLMDRPRVVHIAWGGGSPTMLEPADILRLARATWNTFNLAPGCQFAVEIDPRGCDPARIEALIEAGLTRASIGVQDFEPKVQAAINRHQSFSETAAVVWRLRAGGVGSVNLDLVYGLPHQTQATLALTLEQVLELAPERIALFGYAHVPWLKKHQRLIDEAALAGPAERLAMAEAAAERLVEAGYVRIGLDHFALTDDALARAARAGRLRRNFQGYTDDAPDALIGLGASSIGSLPQGHVQNAVPIGDHARRVAAGRLPAVRGVALMAEDRMRGWVIERLMCDLSFPVGELQARYGRSADSILAQAARLTQHEFRGLVGLDDRRFAVTEQGRPLIRSVCAAFDAYFAPVAQRHSAAV